MKQNVRVALLLLGLTLGSAAQAGKVTYIYTDAQGTPVMESDAQGNITARFDYTPYGMAVQGMSGSPNGPGYTGHVNDPDTGFVYMQGRYYDPSVGRLFSIDPGSLSAEGVFSFNRYLYVNGNPVLNTDPTGMDTCGLHCNEMRSISDSFIFGDGGGGGFGEEGSSNEQASNSQNCDEECQVKKDYDNDFTSHSRQVVSTAQQIAGALSNAMEEGYYYLAADGILKLGPLAKEVEGLGMGYRSFRAFKRVEGVAGPGMDWHHIVEQTSGNMRSFGKYLINSEGNLIKISRAEHVRVSAFYSSKQPFTSGMTVREWLSGQSFEKQLSFGKQVLWRMGINAPE